MSSLLLNGRWSIPPFRYIEFGQLFSLAKPTFSQHEYVFPFAHIISLMPSSRMKIAGDILDSFNKAPWLELPSEQMVLRLVENGLAKLTPQERYIVARREGLGGNTKMTLDQIGKELERTRERIRQIESKAWARIRHPGNQSIFREALIYALMHQSGSLLLRLDSARSLVTGFLVKCNSIPLCIFPYTNIAVIGANKGETLLPSETNLYSSDLK